MKLTAKQLRKLIKEELSRVLAENGEGYSIEEMEKIIEDMLMDGNSLYDKAQFNQAMQLLDSLETEHPGITQKMISKLINKVKQDIKREEETLEAMRATPEPEDLGEKEVKMQQDYAQEMKVMHLFMKLNELTKLSPEIK